MCINKHGNFIGQFGDVIYSIFSDKHVVLSAVRKYLLNVHITNYHLFFIWNLLLEADFEFQWNLERM